MLITLCVKRSPRFLTFLSINAKFNSKNVLFYSENVFFSKERMASIQNNMQNNTDPLIYQ